MRTIYKNGNGDLWATTVAGIVKILGPANFKAYAVEEELPGYKTASLYDAGTKGESGDGVRK